MWFRPPLTARNSVKTLAGTWPLYDTIRVTRMTRGGQFWKIENLQSTKNLINKLLIELSQRRRAESTFRSCSPNCSFACQSIVLVNKKWSETRRWQGWQNIRSLILWWELEENKRQQKHFSQSRPLHSLCNNPLLITETGFCCCECQATNLPGRLFFFRTVCECHPDFIWDGVCVCVWPLWLCHKREKRDASVAD